MDVLSMYQLRTKEGGQALVLAVFMILLFLVFLGVIDIARVVLVRRKLESAASAAALAGAQAMAQHSGSETAANTAAQSVFTADGVQGSVAVVSDTDSGTGSDTDSGGGSDYSIQATVYQMVSTPFLSLSGVRRINAHVSVTAEASSQPIPNPCAITILLPPALGLLYINSGLYDSQTVFGSGISVNGNACVAGQMGASTTVPNPCMVVSGIFFTGSSPSCIVQAKEQTYGYTPTDPFAAYFKPPQKPGPGGCSSPTTENPNVICNPGYYGLFPFGSCLDPTPGSGGSVTLNPGLYYIGTGCSVDLSAPGNTLIQGSGVMIYAHDPSAISLTTSLGGISLSAPPSAPYPGGPTNTLLWVNGTSSTDISVTNSATTGPLGGGTWGVRLTGTIYNPKGGVGIFNYYDSLARMSQGEIVAQYMSIGGSGPVQLGTDVSTGGPLSGLVLPHLVPNPPS